MKSTVFALASMLLFYCGEKESVIAPRSFAVTAESVRMRAEPSIGGSVLRTFGAGDEVFVDFISDQEETIGGRRGRWHRATFGCGAQGWIFGAFLKQDGETANRLFTAAREVERKDPQSAILIYQSIIKRFPNATLVESCHGAWPFSVEAEMRISFARCELEARPGFESFQAATQHLLDELQRANPELSKLAACELVIENGPLVLSHRPAAGLRVMLKLLQEEPPDLATPEFHENRVLLAPQTKPAAPPAVEAEKQMHQFYFEHRGAGWFLTRYCGTCSDIY